MLRKDCRLTELDNTPTNTIIIPVQSAFPRDIDALLQLRDEVVTTLGFVSGNPRNIERRSFENAIARSTPLSPEV